VSPRLNQSAANTAPEKDWQSAFEVGRPLTPRGVTQVKFAKEVVTTNQQLSEGWVLVCVGQTKFAKEVVSANRDAIAAKASQP